MKKIINSLMLFAALTLVWGCSSGDDEKDSNLATDNSSTKSAATFEAAEAPQWSVNMYSNQAQPQWLSPDPTLYEDKMIAVLRLQEELVPFSTDDDLMAVFVGDECRALSHRSGNGEAIYYVLNIYGNSAADPEQFALCYYSGGLKQEFWRRGENGFLNEMNVGTESDFVLDLMTGTTKYERQTVFVVTPKVKEGVTIDADADRVGVFVNGECRGVGKPGRVFNVFHRQDETQAELRYYSRSKGGIFTQTAPLTLDAGYQTIDFNF